MASISSKVQGWRSHSTKPPRVQAFSSFLSHDSDHVVCVLMVARWLLQPPGSTFTFKTEKTEEMRTKHAKTPESCLWSFSLGRQPYPHPLYRVVPCWAIQPSGAAKILGKWMLFLGWTAALNRIWALLVKRNKRMHTGEAASTVCHVPLSRLTICFNSCLNHLSPHKTH